MMPFMRLIIALLAIGLAAPAAAGEAETITGQAFAMDGDSLGFTQPDGSVLSVRLWGIDAPEMATAGGWYARLAMDGLIARHGLPVTCRQVDTDRHKRAVAVCLAADGTDLALQLIAAGWATEYRKYSRNLPALTDVWPRYAEAEARAAAKRLGRWTGGDPATSWVDHFDRFQTFIFGLLGFAGLWGTTWWGFREARRARQRDAKLDRDHTDWLRLEEARALASGVLAEAERGKTAVGTMKVCLDGGMDIDHVAAEFRRSTSFPFYGANVEHLGLLGYMLTRDTVNFFESIGRYVEQLEQVVQTGITADLVAENFFFDYDDFMKGADMLIVGLTNCTKGRVPGRTIDEQDALELAQQVVRKTRSQAETPDQ